MAKSKYIGIVYIIAAAFCFATMNTFVRLSGDLPFIQKSFFRNLVALFFATIVLLKNNKKFYWKKGNLPYLLIRATFGSLGVICNFYAIDHLLLANASMLNKMSPFFAIALCFIFLKEKVTFVQILGVAIAFIGSLFIVKPSFQNISFFPSLIGLLGGFGAGTAYTAVRVLSKRKEDGSFVVFFFSAFSCLIMLPYVLLFFKSMSLLQTLFLFAAGLSAAGGQFSITAAYYHAPASKISVYDYSQVLFAAIMGFFIFAQIPDAFSVIGYFLICGSAIAMFFYNENLNKKLKDHVN